MRWIDCKLLFQSSGIVPFSQIFLKRSVRTSVEVLRSPFHFCMDGISASSFPTLYGFDGEPNFYFSWGTGVNVQRDICWWESAGSSSGVWLSTSQKCCTHLAAYVCSVVRLLPSLSLTGADWLVLLPLSF